MRKTGLIAFAFIVVFLFSTDVLAGRGKVVVNIGNAWIRLFVGPDFSQDNLIVFYSDSHPRIKKYRKFRVGNIQSYNGNWELNNRVASIQYKIPAGWRVVLYELPNYQGEVYYLTGCGYLTQGTLDGWWRNRISSMRWERIPNFVYEREIYNPPWHKKVIILRDVWPPVRSLPTPPKRRGKKVIVHPEKRDHKNKVIIVPHNRGRQPVRVEPKRERHSKPKGDKRRDKGRYEIRKSRP